MVAQGVAPAIAHHPQGELVPDVDVVRAGHGQDDPGRRRQPVRAGGGLAAMRGVGPDDPRQGSEPGEVSLGIGLPPPIVGRVTRHLHPEQGGLERVEPEVGPHEPVEILRFGPVHAQDAGALGQGVVVADEGPAVAEPPEVLAREETERAGLAQGAGAAPLVGRADGLRAVLDHLEPVCAGQGEHAVHVGALAEEVHREDGLGARGDLAGRVFEVEVEADRAGIDENRGGPHPRDAAGGGEEGERRHQNLVPRPDPQRHQRQQDRVGAGRNAQRVPRAGQRLEVAFEGLDLRPHDELPAAEDPQKGLRQLGFERVVLGVDVEQRDGHGGGGWLQDGFLIWPR